MNPPKKLRISPFVYQVNHVRGLPDAGSCHPDMEAINLAETQTDDAKRDTLLHEALHAMLAQGLSESLKELDKSIEETIVSLLAPRLLAMLRDNPTLVDYLRGDA